MFTPADLKKPDDLPAFEQKIYSTHTAGKGGDAARLPNLLEELDAILVDIRFAPPASPIKYSRDYLKLLLKGKYLHVPTLGDRSSRSAGTSRKTAIQNLGLGVKIITELKINLLLFCSCEDNENCHRQLIVAALTRQGREVVEIIDWAKTL